MIYIEVNDYLGHPWTSLDTMTSFLTVCEPVRVLCAELTVPGWHRSLRDLAQRCELRRFGAWEDGSRVANTEPNSVGTKMNTLGDTDLLLHTVITSTVRAHTRMHLLTTSDPCTIKQVLCSNTCIGYIGPIASLDHS